MSFTSVILVVALLIFGIVFIVPVLTNIQDIQENGLICGVLGICFTSTEDSERFQEEKDKHNAVADNSRPSTVGQTVCDITIEVRADLIDSFGKATIFIDKDNNPSDYQWHCQFPNQWGFLNNLTGGFSLLDIFAFESEFIHTELRLVSMSDRSKWYEATDDGEYDTMYRDIRLTQTSGIIPTPYRMDQTYYIEDVVHGNYVMEIYFGKEINNLPVGEPYLDKICKVGTPC